MFRLFLVYYTKFHSCRILLDVYCFEQATCVYLAKLLSSPFPEFASVTMPKVKTCVLRWIGRLSIRSSEHSCSYILGSPATTPLSIPQWSWGWGSQGDVRRCTSAHLAAEDLEGTAVAPVVVPRVGHQPVGGARLGGGGGISHNIYWLGVATTALLTKAKNKSQNCNPTNRNPMFYSILRVLLLLAQFAL